MCISGVSRTSRLSLMCLCVYILGYILGYILDAYGPDVIGPVRFGTIYIT